MPDVRRGQMWFYAPSNAASGHVQGGNRPVIIVSNNVLNATSPVLIVVPCTRQVKRNFPTHVLFVSEGDVAVALTEQLESINKDDLTTCMGYVESYIMDQVDTAIEIALGLKDTPYARAVTLGEI